MLRTAAVLIAELVTASAALMGGPMWGRNAMIDLAALPPSCLQINALELLFNVSRYLDLRIHNAF